jgi:hypothetical protein
MATPSERTDGLIMASVAVIKGVPRDRYEAWCRADGIPGMDNEDAVDLFDWVTTMVDVDFRDE